MNFNGDDLQAAARTGIITPGQSDALLQFFSARGQHTHASESAQTILTDADNERFRLLGGFNDIFAAIGVALLYGALVIAASSLLPVLATVISAAVAWGLSEIFARRMRLALPSILLTIIFSVSVAASMGIVLTMLDHVTAYFLTRPERVTGWLWFSGFHGILVGASAIAATFFHYHRFGVPIAFAVGMIGLIGAVFALIGVDLVMNWHRTFLALAGLATFALALSIDTSDPLRQTTRSDAAFWLHLLAAPLIIHPVVGSLTGPFTALTTQRAVVTLMIFALLAIVSLAIDRRAILVSALLYTGVALAYLVQNIGLASRDNILMLTLLVLAVVVLSLSAGWSQLRARIVPILPLGALAQRLPPIIRNG